MTRDEIEQYLVKTGWELQSNKSYTKELIVKTPEGVKNRLFRVRFNKKSITVELKGRGFYWIRMAGDWFISVRLRPADGAMLCGSYAFPPPARS